MVGTICPAGSGDLKNSSEPQYSAFLYFVGGVSGALVTGVSLALIASLVFSGLNPVVALAASGVGASILAFQQAALIRLTLPQRAKQVPHRWRLTLPPRLASLAYGAGLGLGVLTHISVATLYLLFISTLLAGSAALAVGGLLVFGVCRALPPPLLATFDGLRPGRDAVGLIDRIWASTPIIKMLNAGLLGVVGGAQLAASSGLHL